MTSPAELLPTESTELNTFLRVVHGSLAVRRHEELFQWLRDDVQILLPHEILIAAWGDFSLGIIHLDVISQLPGMRTVEVDKQNLSPLLLKLFARWAESKRSPLVVSFIDEGASLGVAGDETNFCHLITHMRTSLIQGIKDERGRQDCLYVMLSPQHRGFDRHAVQSMELLLPYIDMALRQVSHLPVQCPDPSVLKAELDQDGTSSPSGSDGNIFHLSQREIEIMHWVQLGKTNVEIGLILDISSFTVKNHLQRIFRKINVMNRAQAVSILSKVVLHRSA